MKIARYGVYWANLDPVVGAEISETRRGRAIGSVGRLSRLYDSLLRDLRGLRVR